MTFQLDASGYVLMGRRKMVRGTNELRFSDLTPFTQGYIEALFASLKRHPHSGEGMLPLHHDAGTHRVVAFSDLAPETLARIIADCERCVAGYKALGIQTIERFAGFNVWTLRQAGSLVEQGFPPLTVQLGDDGKVHLS